MRDLQEAFSKGYDAGQRNVLNMVNYILDDAPQSGYSGLSDYYKISMEILLEVFGYGKEEKEKK